MHEPQFREISGAVSTSLKAEELVYALGLLLRGEELPERENAALVEGQRLLEQLGASESSDAQRGAGTWRRLGADRGALGTLHAALRPLVGDDVQAQARRLAEALGRVLGGGDISADRDALEKVRELFANLSRVAGARITTLSRRRRERLSWPATTTSSTSS